MHLNQLRLLHSISQKVDELNIEENRFLLSSTQDFLHQLISHDDAPFIFEKIGTQLEHIMIDEFQDTSTVQWRNFKVLLDECLSHTDTRNLIVGDVKQSIYRWRSGDWQLLNNIDQQFDHYDQIAAEPPIDTNYRSLPHIINFNNHFFELAAMTEANDQEEDYPNGARELRHAYQKVIQKWPKDKHNAGMVNIKLLPNDADYDDATLKETAELILQLLAAKVKPGSIAILGRTNSDITKIADYLMQVLPEDVQLVSDQAFRLDASQAVCLLIQALHLLTHSDDRLALASVVKTYQMDILHTQTDLNQWMSTESLYTLLPKEYNGHQEELRAMPLYDLAEHLFHIFQLEKLQSQGAYLCTFFDLLNQFTTDNTADIDLLVQQWDASLCAKTIQSSENKGIRLISIHKSKGLEFDNVIMPYCDWKLEKLNEPIWCKPTEAPYNQLPIVPINFSSSMKGTIYEKDYLMEHLQNCVDNLNLLYVAFTRASQNLFVIGKQKGTNSRSALIEKLLPIMAEKLHADLSEDPMEFTYGDLYVAEDKKEKESHNIFLQKGHDIWPDILSMDNQMEFRQSNQSKDFINNDEDEEAGKMSYIKLGSILHEIFSTIRTHNDIDTALARLEEDGILYDNELTTQRITTMLRKRLENEQIADWFSGKWKLFNECTILQRDNNNDTILNQRPDRVMMKDDEIVIVDFKFAKQKEEHERQVRGYRDLIAGMGYKQTIHCYLWYVYPNKIVEVK
jgi:ATP-dependent exoDNAse (exonuclease V) beta subunit